MLRHAVHTAAAGASSEQEFFTRLEAAGLLVRKRFSQRDRGQVTGSSPSSACVTGPSSSSPPTSPGSSPPAADRNTPAAYIPRCIP
jgi:hypothetical protein